MRKSLIILLFFMAIYSAGFGSAIPNRPVNVSVVVSSPISINLLNPGSGVDYSAVSQAVVFQYSASGVNITNCSLIVNSNAVNSSVTAGYLVNASGGINSFTNNFAVGSYNWRIICTNINNFEKSSETRTFTITAPAAPVIPSAEPSGGGGGAPVDKGDIIISPDEMAISVVAGTTNLRFINIINNRGSPVNLNVRFEGEIVEALIPESSGVSLNPGETKDFKITIIPKTEDFLVGKIIFRSGSFVKEVSVIINVRSANFLFDSAISVPGKYNSVVSANESIPVQVHLIQLGMQEEVNVSVTYTIKDFSGNVFFEQTEIVSVFEAKDYVKDLSAFNLPPGKYVVGLEISYPGAFATSSAQIEIVGGSNLSTIIASFIAGILIIGFIIHLIRFRKILDFTRRFKSIK